jgi:hypothetical protein
MTYSQAQAALVAIGVTFSVTGVLGHSLSSALTRILVSTDGLAHCPGSVLDVALSTLLGVSYAQAQANLTALGHSISATGLEGHSLSDLLSRVLVDIGGSDICPGSTFDEALRVALGITP